MHSFWKMCCGACSSFSTENLTFVFLWVHLVVRIEKYIFVHQSWIERTFILNYIHYQSKVQTVIPVKKKYVFVMLLNKVSYAHHASICLIQNTVKTVILWNIITIWNNFFLFEFILKCNLFLWCKTEFSASLLQSWMSHDPSEIILTCWFDAKLILVLSYS